MALVKLNLISEIIPGFAMNNQRPPQQNMGSLARMNALICKGGWIQLFILSNDQAKQEFAIFLLLLFTPHEIILWEWLKLGV